MLPAVFYHSAKFLTSHFDSSLLKTALVSFALLLEGAHVIVRWSAVSLVCTLDAIELFSFLYFLTAKDNFLEHYTTIENYWPNG